MVMSFFDYLFFKYYRFQEKVGNGDIALFTAMLFIVFVCILYCFSVFYTIIVIFPNVNSSIASNFLLVGLISVPIGVIVWYFIAVLHKKRYKKIFLYYKENSRNSWGAVLFAIMGFLFCLIAMTLKILQNNGKI